MIYQPETVKGFEDILPPNSLKRDAIKKIAEKHFKLYGFVPIETPFVEFDELMRSENLPTEEEDEAIADRFRLKDKGGRSLGLRYEFTFQLARIIKQNPNIKLPFRRSQIGQNFRDEPLRAGRMRQFTQCDVDIIGESSVNADVECLAVMSDIMKELKIDFTVQVNNRKLLNEIIKSVKLPDSKQVMRELDKIDKIGEDNVKMNLKKHATSEQIITLFKLLDKDIEFFKKNLFDGAEELSELVKKCKDYDIKVKFNPSMVRGFSYYTGNIFEALVGKTAILAGGRYDKLVGKYLGRDVPAVGASFGIESLMALCEKEINKLPLEAIPKVIVISLQQDKETIKLAQKLRKEGISALAFFTKAGKALEYANAENIPYSIFVGQEEISKKKFKLKNMKSGEESLLAEKSLISRLKK